MKKIFLYLFSMQFTAVLFVIFGTSIAAATFIENDFGTDAARAAVYNAKWFEVLLLLGMINLIINVFKAKLYLKHKLPSFIFHLSFIVIIAGAGITRYTGFEGIMSIREGSTSDVVLSDKASISLILNDGRDTLTHSKDVILSPVKKNKYQHSFSINGQSAEIKLKDYIPDAEESISFSESGIPMIELVVTAENGRRTLILSEGDESLINGTLFSFNGPANDKTLHFSLRNGQAYIESPFPLIVMSMGDNSTDTLQAGNPEMLLPMHLYNTGTLMFVPKSYFETAQIVPRKIENPGKNQFYDALVFEMNYGNSNRDIVVWGKKGMPGVPIITVVDDLRLSISYGSVYRQLPFSLTLGDFFLERYPGSSSPSWFESKVTLRDPENNILEDRRIFMNNVLNYRGYRFYQSSYDKDEAGTVLSVNKDFWGTWVSYFGYILMALGMILSILNPSSRFRLLSKQVRSFRESRMKLPLIILLLFTITSSLSAAVTIPVSEKHAASFGELLVQDHGGRIEPVSTLSSEILRKVSRKTTLEGQVADQVLLGMILDPSYWQSVPMLKVSNDLLAQKLGLSSKYASFRDFFDSRGYILGDEVNTAFQKKPAFRSKYDNELIRLDERLNVSYLTYTLSMLRIFPVPGDAGGRWVSPQETEGLFRSEDSAFVRNILPAYLHALMEDRQSGDYSNSDTYLEALKAFQKKYGGNTLPVSLKIQLELFYNKASLFERISDIYGIAGFILLILYFLKIFITRLNLKIPIRITALLIILSFILHTAGLAMRWYISGHAPWSNGFEALVYISWATTLAGLIFSRKSGITLPATAVLSFLILHVAHLSWMDPEITNLVPVLKSYWLVIHVAIITASYGFLALGAIMGSLNLILMFLASEKNNVRISLIISELSAIIEMTLIAGLFMLTVGTFLGGVWANESWGRYWGWDAKETWALVTVVVYSFIAHMRMIPGLRGPFAFNLMALLGFSSVIMTYFGVNYYLSGLHSYAAGDPLPVPSFIYYTLGVIAVISLMAYVNQKRIEKTAGAERKE